MKDETKKCDCCNEYKSLNNYYINKSSKTGYSNICKQCTIIRSKINRERNKELYKNTAKNRYVRDFDILSIKKKEYRINNINKIKAVNKYYYDNNKEKIKTTKKTYYNKNKNKINARSINWNKSNKQKRQQTVLKHDKTSIKNLTDRYIKTQLKKRTNLKSEEIPNELIDLKREKIRLQRLINELSNQN